MQDLTKGLYFRQIASLHAARHQAQSADRTLSEVRDYLRRAAGLPPDCRTIENGGLDGVTPANIRDAAMYAMRVEEDITKLFRRASA